MPCEAAFPCATQNEVDEDDAETLIKNGCRAVGEGANMPSTIEATNALHRAPASPSAPARPPTPAASSVSGLEQSQNALRMFWTREEVDERLQGIMQRIHDQCVQHGQQADGDSVNYVDGANRAGFVKVADAMLANGVF